MPVYLGLFPAITFYESGLMEENPGTQDTAIGLEVQDRFLALSSEMQVIVGNDGRFQWVSPNVERVLGWTIEEMVSRPWAEFVHPEDSNATLAAIGHLFSEHKISRFENRYRHKDGSYRWLFWKGQPYLEQQVIYSVAIDITERKQSETLLQQQALILENMAEGAIMADENGTIVFTNSAFDRMFGYERHELLQQSVSVLHTYSFEENERLKAAIFEQLRTHGTFRQEIHNRKKDGSRFMTEACINQLMVNGKVYFVTVQRDITDRVQMEADRLRIENELRGSEQRLQAIINNSKAAIFMKDLQGRYLLMNRECEKLFNITNEWVQGKTDYDLFPPETADMLREKDRQVLVAGTALTLEEQIPLADGVHSYVAIKFPIFDNAGVVYAICGISTDITDRVQNITDLRRAEEELRQKNAILDVINESAPTPIFVKDRQGRIIYANPATCKVLGKSVDEVLGYCDSDLYPNLKDAEHVMDNDRRIMESGQMEVVEESPDGVRTFLGMKVPYYNEAGEVIGLIGISNDITERVQMERDRERILQQEQALRAAAENANRVKDEFLAILSHELRTPMNPILGWAKLLRGGKLNDTKTALAIETIERNAQLQVQLIDDLLDISRILQGKLNLSTTPVNLNTVARAAIETVRLAAEAKAIVIQPIFSSANLVTKGDAGRLQQVIWNLLSNAVKFTPENGQIKVELSQVGTDAEIQVKDSGKGIKSEFLPHVFEHFRQEDGATTRKFGGLGLGLAIARQIVELHGGQIRVESPGEDQGATFIVQLPLASPTAQPSAPLAFQPDSLDLSGLQILVVDDEPDSGDFVAFVLEEAGAIVSRTASGSEALRQMEQTAFNLIISDIGMPEMDGYQLMQQVRSAQSSTIPAIALTAYAGEYDRQQALEAGFQRHLSKPVDLEKLMKEVAALMRV
jgi:PAS domain S-box-containing protein